MGSFKLGKMTLRSLFGKPETVMYPLEKRDIPAGHRGTVEIDMAKCILCGICVKRCPCSWGIWFVYAGLILCIYTTTVYVLRGIDAMNRVKAERAAAKTQAAKAE